MKSLFSHKTFVIALLGAWAAVMAVSCSVTQDVEKSRLVIPGRLVAGADDSLTIADRQWYAFYTDSALCKLIRLTLENNRDMLSAASKVEELRRLYGVQKLNMLPTVTGVVGGSYETNDYHDEAFKKDPEYDLKATIGWEIDLWGGLSAARRQAGSEYAASVEDCRAMEMTLVAEVATAYFNLIALDTELTVVRHTLETRKESVAMAKLRYEGGLTSETVYQQALVEYASTASLVPALESRIEAARTAINLLTGRFPEAVFERGTLMLDRTMPEKLPVGLPATLLQRRPDIRAAAQRLKAAAAKVGVAWSDRFPSLRIGLTGGWENDDVPHLFQSPFSYVMGNISGTIFDFGRRKRRWQASVAACEQARLAYEQTVLKAFKEVHDAVVAFNKTREAAELKGALRDAALKYVKLATVQYQGGTLNYIDVLDAQRRYFDARIGVTNAVRDRYLAIVNLYKALGGGWTPGNIRE